MNKDLVAAVSMLFLSIGIETGFSDDNTSRGSRRTTFEFHQTAPRENRNAMLSTSLRFLLPIFKNQMAQRARSCGHFYQTVEDVFDAHSDERVTSYRNPDYSCHCISVSENNEIGLDYVTCLGIDSGFCSREGTIYQGGNQLCRDNLGGPDPAETCPNPMATGAVLIDDNSQNPAIDTNVCRSGSHLLCIREEYQGVAADRCFALAAENAASPTPACSPDTAFPKTYRLAVNQTAISACYLGQSFSTTIRNTGSGRGHYCMVGNSRIMNGMNSGMEACFGDAPDGKKVCVTNVSEPTDADRCDVTVDLR